MDQPITRDNLVHEMLAALPELEESYQDEIREWEPDDFPGTYTIIGSTLAHAFKHDLTKGELTDFLRRSALFIERVSMSGDPEALNVVWIKIFEWLIFRPGELKRIWPILGPATKRHIRDAGRRWTNAGRRLGHGENPPVKNIPKD